LLPETPDAAGSDPASSGVCRQQPECQTAKTAAELPFKEENQANFLDILPFEGTRRTIMLSTLKVCTFL
jgi:hypothetical protein